MIPIADELGVTSLYLLYGWLMSSIIASDYTSLKAYGDRSGLAAGLVLAPIAVLLTLAFPPRVGSPWYRYVRPGDVVAAMGGLILLVALVLPPWYKLDGKDGSFTDVLSSWDLWRPIELILAFVLPIATAIIFFSLHSIARGRAPEWLRSAVVAAGAVALLMTLVEMFTVPDGASLEIGAYLAALGSLTTIIAGMIALRGRTIGEVQAEIEEEGAARPHPAVPREILLGTRYERVFADVLVDSLFAAGFGFAANVVFGLFLGDAALALGVIAAMLYRPITIARIGEHNGQTFGKQMVGLRVISDDGQPISLLLAMRREFLLKGWLGVVTAGLFLLVSGLLSFRRTDRKALHDQWSRTVVVRSASRWVAPPDDVIAAPAAPSAAGEPVEVRAA